MRPAKLRTRWTIRLMSTTPHVSVLWLRRLRFLLETVSCDWCDGIKRVGQSLLRYLKTHIWNTGSESSMSRPMSYFSHSGANVPGSESSTYDTLGSESTWERKFQLPLRDRGQFLKVEAEARPKIINFTLFLARKMPDFIITQRDRGRGQMFEAEATSLRLRPKFWPRGHFGLEDLTSLVLIL